MGDLVPGRAGRTAAGHRPTAGEGPRAADSHGRGADAAAGGDRSRVAGGRLGDARAGRAGCARGGRVAGGVAVHGGDGECFAACAARACRQAARDRRRGEGTRRDRGGRDSATPAAARRSASGGGAEQAGRPFHDQSARRNSTESESAPRAAPPISLQTVALAAGLAAIVGAIIYFLQPPSADALFRRIDAQTGGNDPEAVRQAADDIDSFLYRFPGDPRCQGLRDKRQEIESGAFAAEVRAADAGPRGRRVVAAGRAGVSRRLELRAARSGARHGEAPGPDRPLRRSCGGRPAGGLVPGVGRAATCPAQDAGGGPRRATASKCCSRPPGRGR